MTDFAPDDIRKKALEAAKKLLSQNKLASGQNKLHAAQRADRADAETGKNRKDGKSIILRSDQIRGDFDASQLLNITLGNEKRAITEADILAYRENIKRIEKQFGDSFNGKGGISPREVINLSLDVDRKRASEEIHLAIPFTRKGGVIRFMTNASEQSKDEKHYVTIDIVGYANLLTGSNVPKTTRVRTQVEGRVRFDCDCGRHRYWGYRYIATLGNYHYGEREDGFPKIRNDGLAGVACKHVLRVMHFLLSPSGVLYVQNMAKKDHGKISRSDDHRADAQTKSQVEQEIERQADDAHHDKKKVMTQDQREQTPANQKRKAKAEEKANKKAQEQAIKDAKRIQEQQDKDKSALEKKEAKEQRQRNAMHRGIITIEDYEENTGTKATEYDIRMYEKATGKKI